MIRNTISKIMLLIALVAVLCAPSACASSTRLDRNKAAEMISHSVQFTQPYTIIVQHASNKRYMEPISPDETRAQGEARAVENFFDSTPYRAVLRELGLIDVKAKFAGVESGRGIFELTINLTDRGRQLWRDLNLPADTATLPLATRELVAVTGITGDEKTRRATVEFDWRWVPTVAGRAMMRGTPEFSRLPERIKKQFNEEGLGVFNIGAHPPLELGGTHRSVASFQLYDDGWRLEPLPFDNRPLNPLD